MKKLAIIAALVIAFTSMTYAQKSGTQNITINAKIIQGLVLSGLTGSLNFGDPVTHTTVKGALTAADSVINVSSDARAVNFQATGDGGQSITVTYPATLALGTITFTPTTQWTSSTTQSGGTSFASGASFSLGGSLYSASTRYIWLGGSLAGVAVAAPGTYTGTFTFTVAYTGL
ncbi:MAG: DUF4402 domain-containing protein [Candidatus Kryptoniota bacterium]